MHRGGMTFLVMFRDWGNKRERDRRCSAYPRIIDKDRIKTMHRPEACG